MFGLEEQELVEVDKKDLEFSARKGAARKDRINLIRDKETGSVLETRYDEKVRLTAQVDFDLAERVKDALYWLAGHPELYTLRRMVSEAMEAKLALLAKKYEGRPFVRDGAFIPRTDEIKTGRPPKYAEDRRRRFRKDA